MNWENIKKGDKSLKVVLPQDVAKLNKKQMVMVNRIRINSMLTEIALAEITVTEEQIKILKDASQKIKKQEKDRRCAIMGAQMKVEDILKVFKNTDKLPSNSFAILK